MKIHRRTLAQERQRQSVTQSCAHLEERLNELQKLGSESDLCSATRVQDEAMESRGQACGFWWLRIAGIIFTILLIISGIGIVSVALLVFAILFIGSEMYAVIA